MSNRPAVAAAIVALSIAVSRIAAAQTAAAPSERPGVEIDGPSEIRDEQLLAQPRLTLPATQPQTLGHGRTVLRASVLWSNSFGWTQDVPGEHPGDRRFLVDGETATLDLTVTRGLRDHLDVGLRLPLHWRGGGVLDGVIDAWHRLFDLPDGNRPDFLENAFRVEGVTEGGRAFSWNDHRGGGVGAAEAFARWRVHESRRFASAFVTRLALPTGTGPFKGGGVGLGIQWVGERRLGSAFRVYAGLGGTAQSGDSLRGIGYEAVRGHAFAALQWKPWRRLSFVAETNIASRLVKDVDRYPGTHWLINGEMIVALSSHAGLELGFTENFASQMATTDFALQLGLRLSPGSRPASRASGPRARR